jgi:carboxypeptidase family protein
MDHSRVKAIADALRAAGIATFALAAGACVTAPRPTDEAVRRAANPGAVVEGRVLDPDGHPVFGVAVWGLPRDKDLGWSAPAVSDAAGRFRLVLVAPGTYGFLVSWKGVTIVTPRPDDPTRVLLPVRPGDRKSGVAIVFRREEWDRALLAPPRVP